MHRFFLNTQAFHEHTLGRCHTRVIWLVQEETPLFADVPSWTSSAAKVQQKNSKGAPTYIFTWSLWANDTRSLKTLGHLTNSFDDRWLSRQISGFSFSFFVAVYFVVLKKNCVQVCCAGLNFPIVCLSNTSKNGHVIESLQVNLQHKENVMLIWHLLLSVLRLFFLLVAARKPAVLLFLFFLSAVRKKCPEIM